MSPYLKVLSPLRQKEDLDQGLGQISTDLNRETGRMAAVDFHHLLGRTRGVDSCAQFCTLSRVASYSEDQRAFVQMLLLLLLLLLSLLLLSSLVLL